MKYELNDKPGMLPMLMYGLQWWIVSLPCVVIMGIIVSQLHYTNVAEQTFYLQKLFGIMGIVMIVQVLWGTSVTADYRAGIGIVDWDSVYCVVGDSGCLHWYYGGWSSSDRVGI